MHWGNTDFRNDTRLRLSAFEDSDVATCEVEYFVTLDSNNKDYCCGVGEVRV